MNEDKTHCWSAIEHVDNRGKVYYAVGPDRWTREEAERDAEAASMIGALPEGGQMTLTVAQLEDALWCAHKAKEHMFLTANAERADRLIAALEAEIERLEQLEPSYVQRACGACGSVIGTTDDHMSECRNSNWLPARKEEAK